MSAIYRLRSSLVLCFLLSVLLTGKLTLSSAINAESSYQSYDTYGSQNEEAAKAPGDGAAEVASTEGTTVGESTAAPSCSHSDGSTPTSVTEARLETLLSELREAISAKIDSLPKSTSGSSCSGGSDTTKQKQETFNSCLDSLSTANVETAITQWTQLEETSFGPTGKSALLKDLLYLAYEKSKSASVKFSQRLASDASKNKFLPAVYDVLQEAAKLNGDSPFVLGSVIKSELSSEQSSAMLSKLPKPVQIAAAGKPVRLSYTCKTLQKKLDVHIRGDDTGTWEREYWPVVASTSYNHTKGALWTFEPVAEAPGTFKVRNSWFGDYLWIEPNYQNLRTVDLTTKRRNGTEFTLELASDNQGVTLHSVLHKLAPVAEGYFSRKTDTSRPLRVTFEQPALVFKIEEASE